MTTLDSKTREIHLFSEDVLILIHSYKIKKNTKAFVPYVFFFSFLLRPPTKVYTYVFVGKNASLKPFN